MIRPHARRRLLPVVLIVVLLAFGCDSDAEVPDDEDVAATRDEAEGPAGDTPAPTPTPSPAGDADEGEPEVPEAGDPPSLDGLVSDDELEVARTMNDYNAWLLRTPDTDPELIAEIVDPDGATNVYERQHRLFAHYFENQLWWTGGESELIDVEVIEDQSPNLRQVRLHYRRSEPMELIDPDGEVHRERDARRWWSEEVWAREDSDGPWRVIGLGESQDLDEG